MRMAYCGYMAIWKRKQAEKNARAKKKDEKEV
jgi:hypothetical protein